LFPCRMTTLLRCVVACALIACVFSHAVLLDPRPLNTNPTTQQTCGVANYPANPVPVANWVAGETKTITWQLIASDGGTSFSGYLRADGKVPAGTQPQAASFTEVVFTGVPMDKGLTTYTTSFKVPDMTCAPACLFRVVSANWNSCAYVNITCATCPKPPPPPPVCKQASKATGLNFCLAVLDGKNVQVYADTSIATQDTDAETLYKQNIVKDTVFITNGTACQQAYREYVCKDLLVPCPGSGQRISSIANCQATCQNLISKDVCNLNPLHKDLFDCSKEEACLNESGAASLVASLAGLFAVFLALLL
jgi:hypothetical protein